MHEVVLESARYPEAAFRSAGRDRSEQGVVMGGSAFNSLVILPSTA
jgi:hypothetical protein